MSRVPSRLGIVVLLLSHGAACQKKEHVDAPTRVTASVQGFDTIVVVWSPPEGAETIEMDQRVEAGAWERYGAGSGVAFNAVIPLRPDAPEAATYGFRVRATRRYVYSDWAETTVFRGVRRATNLVALAGGPGGPIELTWTRGSTQADALRIERQLVAADGTAGPWAPLATLPLDATSYADEDVAAWVDGASLVYRLFYSKAGTDSEPAVARTSPAPPLVPAKLAASAARGVVDASDVVDAVADGAPALGFTALPGLPLAISARALPPREQVARDAQGRFATVEADPGHDAVRTSRETEGGLDVHEAVASGAPALARRALLFGPAGRLHVLWAVVNDGTLRHDFLDGTTWSSDALTAAPPQDAVVDAAGALHLVSCDGLADYHTNASGAWVTTRLPASQSAERCALAVGPLGDVRVVYSSPRPVPPGEGGSPTASELRVLTSAGAGWAEELVPVGAEGTLPGDDVLRIFAPAADRTVLLYEAPSAGAATARLESVARDAAGWGAPVEVAVRTPGALASSFAAAAAPDGSRVAAAWTGAAGGGLPATVAIRDAAGAWTSFALHDTDGGVAVGFSPGGKLWVLDGLGVPFDALLYEEP